VNNLPNTKGWIFNIDNVSDLFQFWTHGADVIAEYTKEYTGHDNDLYLRRAGWGAQVKQKKGSSNWFHFAIPSATRVDGHNVSRCHAWLRAKVNNDAKIDRVHLREAAGPQSNCPIIYDSGSLNLTGQDEEFGFNLPDNCCTGPLVMCVHVIFEGDEGEVVFAGAGVRFEAWI
jgi:hypothetical protein